jgi:hypothetical protein
MMPGDTWHSQKLRVSIQYSHVQDLNEDVPGTQMTGYPVVDSEEYVKIKPGSVNGALYFAGGVSAFCLTTVALVPNRIVQGVALAVLGGSFGLAKLRLTGKYRRT